jgi:hypothetical protein
MTETPSVEPETAAAAAPATEATKPKATPFWKRLLGKS